jgi:hypothetical protein
MVDRFDFELRAIDADIRAESAGRFSLAENWRDIAIGYRLLSDFLAHEQTAEHNENGTGLNEGR